MFVGVLEFDLLLADVHSLKQKRAAVRPVIAALRRWEVSVAEVAHQDLHRRAGIAVAVAAADAARCREILDRCEDLVAGMPQIELLSTRRRLFGDHDDE